MNLKSPRMLIKENYNTFTSVEKTIAKYFLKEKVDEDLSSKNIAKKLFVSESSLSRFSQKLGFSGYREFVFSYTNARKENKKLDELTEYSIHKYQMVLEKTHEIVDNQQMIRIAKALEEKSRIYVYGVGSSSLVAKEFAYRFIRLGLDVESMTDANEIALNIGRMKKDVLVIGISMSGHTKEVIEGLEIAHNKGAFTIILTMKRNFRYDFCDEVVLLSYVKNLTASYIMSPQIPALVMIDVIYTHYLNYNKEAKLNHLNEGLRQIDFTLEK